MKFGIFVPTSIAEAEELDRINGNNLWREAINKEINKVKVAFQPLNEGESAPVGSKLIKCHMVFDVKFNLTQKARLVAAEYMNNVPAFTLYSPVISRETVRICFMLAALNGLGVMMGDVSNAFIQANPRERCHVVIQDDHMFGPISVGQIALIVHELYRMKSSSEAWSKTLATVLEKELLFKNCVADPDIWMKVGTKAKEKILHIHMRLC